MSDSAVVTPRADSLSAALGRGRDGWLCVIIVAALAGGSSSEEPGGVAVRARAGAARLYIRARG